MNNILYTFLLLCLITSCTEDEGVNFQPDSFYIHTASTVVNEADGTIDIMFTSTKSYSTNLNINFTLTGTADDTIDYTSPTTSATILSGELSTIVTLTLIDDNLIEDQENIIITVTDTSNSELYIDDSDMLTITLIDDESIAYQNGILISNYGNTNGTVTYINNDLDITEQLIYNTVNAENIGDGLQSIGFNNDKAYLVSYTDDKIIVVNKNSFLKETTITTGLDHPKYFAVSSGKGYVTNWGDPMLTSDDFIAVVDLDTNLVISSISVDEKPEKIISKNGKLYISHIGGTNNLTIIDASDDSVSTVAINGAVLDDLLFDSSNTLWILSEGDAVTGGKLIQFNTSNETTTSLDFAMGEHPKNLSYSDGNLYYDLNDEIFTLAQTDTALPTTAIITTPVYKMAVNNGKLYVTNDPDTISNGSLKVFDITDNSELQTLITGVIPGGIYFN